MKHYVCITTLILISAPTFADVDYTRCNASAGMSLQPLNNDGQLELQSNQKIVSKTTEGKLEKYIIETNYGVYGTPKNGANPIYKSEISLERDDQGRVVKIVTGGDKLDKKTVDLMKEMQIKFQVNTAVFQAGLNRAPYDISHEGGGGGYFGPSEQTFAVKDKKGKTIFKKLSELTKEERAQAGLSEDLYKEMMQKSKRDKKSAAKIEKGMKELFEKSTPVYYIGQESEYEIKDDVCYPKSVATRMFNSKDGSIYKQKTFSKEACEEVSKLYLKHKENIARCDVATKAVTADIYENYSKLKDLTGNTYGMFGSSGMGMMGGMGSLAFSPYGTPNQITMMKNYCDTMTGEEFSFIDKTIKSEANKQ